MATAVSSAVGPKFALRPKHFVFGFIGLMMAYVAVHNEYFLVQPNAPIWEHYRPIRWWLLPHGICAACALLLGPMQFSDRLRQRNVKLHHVVGYIYVVGVLLGAPLGALTQYAEGPPTWVIATIVDAVIWTTTTAIALLFILKGNVTLHRQWMTRSYAIAIAFLEIRFVMGLTGLERASEPVQLACIWSCIAMALLFADVAIHMQDIMRKRATPR